MYCSQCGSQNAENSVFCNKCGNRLTTQQLSPQKIEQPYQQQTTQQPTQQPQPQYTPQKSYQTRPIQSQQQSQQRKQLLLKKGKAKWNSISMVILLSVGIAMWIIGIYLMGITKTENSIVYIYGIPYNQQTTTYPYHFPGLVLEMASIVMLICSIILLIYYGYQWSKLSEELENLESGE